MSKRCARLKKKNFEKNFSPRNIYDIREKERERESLEREIGFVLTD